MKWFVLKLVFVIYFSSLAVFVMYFPDRNEEIERNYKEKMQEIERMYEKLLNGTVEKQNGMPLNHYKMNQQLGPGAFGLDTDIIKLNMNPEDQVEREELLKKYDYDAYVSDRISLYRIIPDTRPEICKSKVYGVLPAVSIIIPFRDERLSVLLRTIYSILQNTPDDLLQEIIIIDDGSKTIELKSKLDSHIDALPKVRMLRLAPSAGLMVARQTGINMSKADYFITMDCHIEVIQGWLEPLLYRLTQNPKACVSPNVGLIKRDTFRVDVSDRWRFNKFPMFVFSLEEAPGFYKPDYLQKINRSEPIPTGINQGMVIAMRKSWFQQLGGFDTGMRVWGSEQVELSVKVWTCGGIVEIVPCSYVAHLFKHRLLWENAMSAKVINVLRFAEVWMDNYKDFIYEYWPTVKYDFDIGPGIKERKLIRRQNRCKPFQYYIDRVKEFGLIHFPENLKNKGWLQNEALGDCVELNETGKMEMVECSALRGATQYFEHTSESYVRLQRFCIFPASAVKPGASGLFRGDCFEVEPFRLLWNYTETKQIRHLATDTCLTATSESQLMLRPCTSERRQIWAWRLWHKSSNQPNKTVFHLL